MQSKHTMRGVLLTSLTFSLLTACTPPNNSPSGPEPEITVSEIPIVSEPGENPSSKTTPEPESSAKPVNPVDAPLDAPKVEAVKLASIALMTENRYLTNKGETTQFKVTLKDVSGQVVSINSDELNWSSSRPGDFSVDANGLTTALIDSGYADIKVSVGELSATQLISVNSADGFTSNSGSSGSSGGGGGGGSSAPSEENLNANIFFEGLGIGEFQVNTETSSKQQRSSVGMSADGNYVIAWGSSGDQDGDSSGIFAQRFNSKGLPQGAEFQVNTYTTGWQDNPSVAMDDDGGFVIAWNGFKDDSDYNYDVYAQRYDSAGVAQLVP